MCNTKNLWIFYWRLSEYILPTKRAYPWLIKKSTAKAMCQSKRRVNKMVKIFVKSSPWKSAGLWREKSLCKLDVFRLTRHSSRSLYPAAGVMPPQWWSACKDSPMVHWCRACGRFGWPATETIPNGEKKTHFLSNTAYKRGDQRWVENVQLKIVWSIVDGNGASRYEIDSMFTWKVVFIALSGLLVIVKGFWRANILQ